MFPILPSPRDTELNNCFKMRSKQPQEGFHVKSVKTLAYENLSSLLSCWYLKTHILNMWNYNRFCIFFLQRNRSLIQD